MATWLLLGATVAPSPPYAYEGHKSLKPIGVNEDEKRSFLKASLFIKVSIT